MVFGILTGSPVRLRCTFGATTFPSALGHFGTMRSPLRARPHPFLTDPPASFQCPRSRSSSQGFTIHLALRGPDCTSSRLFALVTEEDDRLVTQSIATPEPGCPDPQPRSSKPKLAKALSVSPHSGADGLVQGELPPST